MQRAEQFPHGNAHQPPLLPQVLSLKTMLTLTNTTSRDCAAERTSTPKALGIHCEKQKLSRKATAATSEVRGTREVTGVNRGDLATQSLNSAHQQRLFSHTFGLADECAKFPASPC